MHDLSESEHYFYYITFFLHFSVDVQRLEHKNQVNIESMTLDSFMTVHVLGQHSTTPAVTFFELDEDIRDMSKVLHIFIDSHIFKLCWQLQALEYIKTIEQRARVAPVTLDVIQAKIFKPCYSRYLQIYDQLKRGTFQLKQVDEIFKDFKGKYDKLSDDLAIMCHIDSNDHRWIMRKVQQIKQYHEVDLAMESARVVHNVKETLCLQGDFHVLDLLLEVVSNAKYAPHCYWLSTYNFVYNDT